MTKNKSKKKNAKNPKTWADEKLADAVGKTTIVALNWKPWTEFPNSGDRIFVIIKAKNGLVPVTGIYLDETFPASKDGVMPESRWQTVRLDDCGGTAIIGGEGGDCLVAWARPRAIGKLLNAKCPLCKEVPCVC